MKFTSLLCRLSVILGFAGLAIQSASAAPAIQFQSTNSFGTEAAAQVSVVVTQSEVSASSVMVDYSVAGGTAAGGDVDYSLAAGTATIEAGNLATSIFITVTNDLLDEDHETIVITLSNPVNGTMGSATSHVYTITDDDAMPSLSLSDASVTEGDTDTTQAFVTITLSEPSGRTITFLTPASNNTAVPKIGSGVGDFLPTNRLVSMPPGLTSTQMFVTVYGDTQDETDETLFVRINSATSGPMHASIADGEAVVTILDDDPFPVLSITNTSVTEGNSGTTTTAFIVTISTNSGQNVSFDFVTSNGTATAGADYTATSGTFIITAGTNSVAIPVTVFGDLLHETDLDWFSLNIANVSNATPATNSLRSNILDDDAAPVVSINNASVPEGDSGVTQMIFTVSLSTNNGLPAVIGLFTSNGTANASDYQPTNYTLTMPAGVLATTVVVEVFGDTSEELDKTFYINIVSATNVTVGDSEGSGTILDDDVLPPLLAVSNVEVAEGNSGTTDAVFVVSLSRPADQDVTFTIATSNGLATSESGDYLATNQSMTLAVGITNASFVVKVQGDTVDELSNETFTVALSGFDTNIVIVPSAIGQGIIDDDDTQPTLSIGDTSVTEGDAGSTSATFFVSLSEPSGRDVIFTVTTSDGTASAGTDYIGTNTQLAIFAGQTSTTVNVEILGDTESEVDETVLLTLVGATNATLTDLTAAAEILDDEGVPVLSISDDAVTEGNSGTTQAVFTITLSAPLDDILTFDIATADGAAVASDGDYVAQSRSMTLFAGETTTNFFVLVNGDTKDEQAAEPFSVNLTAITNLSIAAVITNATGLIADDDAPPTISVSDTTVIEGDAGPTAAVFTVSISATSGLNVVFSATSSNGLATAFSGDYVSTNYVGLALVPGQTSTTLTVEVTGDTSNEPNEHLYLLLAPITNATAGDVQGLGLIEDDDYIHLEIGDASVTEGDAGTTQAIFSITLSEPLGSDLTFTVASSNIGAASGSDYTAVNQVMTLTAGETMTNIAVNVAGDTVDETDTETFSVSLSAISDPAVFATDAQGAGSILDDDDAPILIIASTNVTEGNAGTTTMDFFIALSEASGRAIQFSLGTTSGTATAGSDYSTSNRTFILLAGTVSTNFRVTVIGDFLDEDSNETFFLNISAATNVSVTNTQVQGAIVDDDATPTLTISDATVTEPKSGTRQVTLGVTLSGGGQSVSFNYATANGTAQAGPDYLSTNGTVVMPSGQTATNLRFTVVGDAVPEVSPETFLVNVTSISNAASGDVSGTVNIEEGNSDHGTPMAGNTIGGFGWSYSLTSFAYSASLADNEYDTFNDKTQAGLVLRNFDLYVPSNGVITGILVRIEGNGSGSTTNSRQFKISLTKNGSNSVGTTRTGVTLARTNDAVVEVGGDLWGTTWLPSEIRGTHFNGQPCNGSGNFGVIITDNDTTSNALNFDLVQVVVSYAPGSGDLDPSFDGDGQNLTSADTSADYRRGVALQSDGSVVAVGTDDDDIAVVRYTPAGALDTTFNSDGIATVNFGFNDEEGNAIAIQTDGRIVVVGTDVDNEDFEVLRLAANGSLDATFSFDGGLTTDIDGGADEGRAVAIQTDGKIIAVGRAFNGADDDIALARYSNSGSPDNSFNGNGRVTLDIGGMNDEANAVILQADGKIVVAGSTFDGMTNHMVLARFTTNGAADSTFGTSGYQIIDVSGNANAFLNALALQADGKIVAAGGIETTTVNPAIIRLDTNGILDASFSGDGMESSELGADGWANAVGVQSSGKLVLAGRFGDSPEASILLRYHTNGVLDEIFGQDGRAILEAESDSMGRALAVQTNDLIVVAISHGEGFVTARYLTDTENQRPDLSISSVTLSPAIPVAGSTFTAYVTVTNNSYVPGNASNLYVYTNKPVEVTNGTTPTKSAVVGTMGPHTSKVITITGISAGSVGARTFRAFVDATAVTVEADESNNQWATSYTIGTLTNLVISGPSTVGESSTNSYVCAAYYSNGISSNVSAIATWAENSRFTTIDAAGVLTTTNTLTSTSAVPITATFGGRTVTNWVVVQDDIKPDFSVVSIVIAPVVPGSGSAFTAYVTITNSGLVSGNAGNLSIYTNKPSPVANGTSPTKSTSVGNLGAQSSRVVTNTGISAGSAGTRVFRALIDANGATSESNETNNQEVLNHDVMGLTNLVVTGPATLREGASTSYVATAYYVGTNFDVTLLATWSENSAYATISAMGILTATNPVTNDSLCTVKGVFGGRTATQTVTIRNSTKPDFTIEQISLAPTGTLPAGKTFTAYVTVKNQGSISGNAWFIDVWTNQATTVTGKIHGSKYATAGTVTSSTSRIYTFTGITAPRVAGSYTFRAGVDVLQGTEEIDETNNQATLVYSVNTITNLAINGPAAVGEATQTQYTCTAFYSGGTSGDVSASATWSENSRYSTITSAGVLATTNTLTSTGSVVITATFGGLTTTRSVALLNDLNPDFVVAGISFFPGGTLPAGKTFTAYVTVTNQGMAAGDAGSLDVWTNLPAPATGKLHGTKYSSVGTLTNGRGRTLTFTGLTAPFSNGVYTFRANVDSQLITGESDESNNQTTASITCKVVTNIVISGVSLINEGTGTQFTCTALFSDGSSEDVTPWATWADNSSLAAMTTNSGQITTTNTLTSNAVIRITANYAGRTTTNSVTVSNSLRPDLRILSITMSPASPILAGASFTTYVLVRNNGSASADYAYYDVWTNRPTQVTNAVHGQSYQRVSSLAALSVQQLTYSSLIGPTANNTNTLRAVVDSLQTVEESNETNNQAVLVYQTRSVTNLLISGPTTVLENDGSQYDCIAYFNDGSTNSVASQATWTDSSSFASINSAGFLATMAVSANTNCTLKAVYGGKTNTLVTTIQNL